MPSHMLNYPTTTTTTQPTPFRVMVWYGAASLWPPTTLKYAKHIIYVWSRSGRSMKRMGGPNHILQHVPSEKWETTTKSYNTAHPLLECASLWPPTIYKACQTPFICIKWIWYEYEVDGRSQSHPTACHLWETSSKSYDCAHPFRVMVRYGVVTLWLPAMIEGY